MEQAYARMWGAIGQRPSLARFQQHQQSPVGGFVYREGTLRFITIGEYDESYQSATHTARFVRRVISWMAACSGPPPRPPTSCMLNYSQLIIVQELYRYSLSLFNVASKASWLYVTAMQGHQTTIRRRSVVCYYSCCLIFGTFVFSHTGCRS